MSPPLSRCIPQGHRGLTHRDALTRHRPEPRSDLPPILRARTRVLVLGTRRALVAQGDQVGGTAPSCPLRSQVSTRRGSGGKCLPLSPMPSGLEFLTGKAPLWSQERRGRAEGPRGLAVPGETDLELFEVPCYQPWGRLTSARHKQGD
jgi:hypothetical protein